MPLITPISTKMTRSTTTPGLVFPSPSFTINHLISISLCEISNLFSLLARSTFYCFLFRRLCGARKVFSQQEVICLIFIYYILWKVSKQSIFMVRPRTILKSVSGSVCLSVSTQISKQPTKTTKLIIAWFTSHQTSLSCIMHLASCIIHHASCILHHASCNMHDQK